jgi:hypothetical protein
VDNSKATSAPCAQLTDEAVDQVRMTLKELDQEETKTENENPEIQI